MSTIDEHGDDGGEPPEPPTEVHGLSPDDDESFWARIKRTLWGSRGRRTISVLAGLLVAVVAVGGIADALNGTSETNNTSAGSEVNGFSGEGCTSGPADANVRVTLYGGESCAEWDQTQSSSGTFWRETPPLPYSENAQLVCSMEGPGGHTLIEVRDTGEHFYGNRICASMTSQGWHAAEGPGVRLEQSRRAHIAEEEANAEQRRATEQKEQHERERPGLEAEAAKLKGEAASLRGKQHHEEALAKADAAEGKRVESEEPEGGLGEIDDKAYSIEDKGYSHEDQASTYKDQAESKETQAKEAEEKASG